jgi:hypothetical protein
MSRYHVLRPIGHLKYELLPPFTHEAEKLVRWIPKRIKEHIDERLGIVPLLLITRDLNWFHLASTRSS